MRAFRVLALPIREISRQELEVFFAESYGIFAGRARKVAKLQFTGDAAQFIAEERWHPQQRMSFLAEGRLRLEVPCGDVRELARDVMRYADEVDVLGPDELITTVDEMVRRAAFQGYLKRRPVIRGKTKSPLSQNDRGKDLAFPM